MTDTPPTLSWTPQVVLDCRRMSAADDSRSLIRRGRIATRFRYLWFVLRHPRSLALLPKGTRAVANDISRRLVEKYAQHPSTCAEVAGLKLYLNPSDKGLISYAIAAGSLEVPLVELVRRVIRPGDIVLDVGANVGYYTLLSAALAGPTGSVFAFEPHPVNFGLLARSVQENHLNWVTPEPLVVSDRSGIQTLYVSEDPSFTGQHSITRRVGTTELACRSTSLDEYASGHGITRIRFLKVDVEGAEPIVLDGAQTKIGDGAVDYIAFEWNPEAWASRTELLKTLFSKYLVYPIFQGGIGPLSISLPAIPDTATNLFLIRKGS
jgi:FkbM family methyltransferase